MLEFKIGDHVFVDFINYVEGTVVREPSYEGGGYHVKIHRDVPMFNLDYPYLLTRVPEKYMTSLISPEEATKRSILDKEDNTPKSIDLEFIYKRWDKLMGRDAVKYGVNNWHLANSQKELDRFKSNAKSHLIQYLAGETDEDHAAAVVFNLAAAEFLKEKLEG